MDDFKKKSHESSVETWIKSKRRIWRKPWRKAKVVVRSSQESLSENTSNIAASLPKSRLKYIDVTEPSFATFQYSEKPSIGSAASAAYSTGAAVALAAIGVLYSRSQPILVGGLSGSGSYSGLNAFDGSRTQCDQSIGISESDSEQSGSESRLKTLEDEAVVAALAAAAATAAAAAERARIAAEAAMAVQTEQEREYRRIEESRSSRDLDADQKSLPLGPRSETPRHSEIVAATHSKRRRMPKSRPPPRPSSQNQRSPGPPQRTSTLGQRAAAQAPQTISEDVSSSTALHSSQNVPIHSKPPPHPTVSPRFAARLAEIVTSSVPTAMSNSTAFGQSQAKGSNGKGGRESVIRTMKNVPCRSLSPTNSGSSNEVPPTLATGTTGAARSSTAQQPSAAPFTVTKPVHSGIHQGQALASHPSAQGKTSSTSAIHASVPSAPRLQVASPVALNSQNTYAPTTNAPQPTSRPSSARSNMPLPAITSQLNYLPTNNRSHQSSFNPPGAVDATAISYQQGPQLYVNDTRVQPPLTAQHHYAQFMQATQQHLLQPPHQTSTSNYQYSQPSYQVSAAQQNPQPQIHAEQSQAPKFQIPTAQQQSTQPSIPAAQIHLSQLPHRNQAAQHAQNARPNTTALNQYSRDVPAALQEISQAFQTPTTAQNQFCAQPPSLTSPTPSQPYGALSPHHQQTDAEPTGSSSAPLAYKPTTPEALVPHVTLAMLPNTANLLTQKHEVAQKTSRIGGQRPSSATRTSSAGLRGRGLNRASVFAAALDQSGGQGTTAAWPSGKIAAPADDPSAPYPEDITLPTDTSDDGVSYWSFRYHSSPKPYLTPTIQQAALSTHQTAQSLQCSVPSMQHNTPPTQHNTPLTHHNAPSMQHTAPTNQHNAPSMQHTAPTNQHNAPCMQHTSPTNEYNAPSNQHNGSISQFHTPSTQNNAHLMQLSSPSTQHNALTMQLTSPSNHVTSPSSPWTSLWTRAAGAAHVASISVEEQQSRKSWHQDAINSGANNNPALASGPMAPSPWNNRGPEQEQRRETITSQQPYNPENWWPKASAEGKLSGQNWEKNISLDQPVSQGSNTMYTPGWQPTSKDPPQLGNTSQSLDSSLKLDYQEALYQQTLLQTLDATNLSQSLTSQQLQHQHPPQQLFPDTVQEETSRDELPS